MGLLRTYTIMLHINQTNFISKLTTCVKGGNVNSAKIYDISPQNLDTPETENPPRSYPSPSGDFSSITDMGFNPKTTSIGCVGQMHSGYSRMVSSKIRK